MTSVFDWQQCPEYTEPRNPVVVRWSILAKLAAILGGAR